MYNYFLALPASERLDKIPQKEEVERESKDLTPHVQIKELHNSSTVFYPDQKKRLFGNCSSLLAVAAHN